MILVVAAIICFGCSTLEPTKNGVDGTKRSSNTGRASTEQRELFVWELGDYAAVLKTAPFNRSGKSITVSSSARREKTYIDGQYAWGGQGGGLATTELASFTIKINGDSYTLPRDMWADCYDPHLVKYHPGQSTATPGVYLIVTPERMLLIKFNGSDAGDGYTAFYDVNLDTKECRRRILREHLVVATRKSRLIPDRPRVDLQAMRPHKRH
ncbi:MAG: hypothetical protein ACR2HJ_02255 [Fimbriimonadales bacterium]